MQTKYILGFSLISPCAKDVGNSYHKNHKKCITPGKMLYGQVMDCASCGRQLLGAVDPEVKPAVQMPGLCAGRIEIRGRR